MKYIKTVSWGEEKENSSSKRKKNHIKFLSIKEELVHVFF